MKQLRVTGIALGASQARIPPTLSLLFLSSSPCLAGGRAPTETGNEIHFYLFNSFADSGPCAVSGVQTRPNGITPFASNILHL